MSKIVTEKLSPASAKKENIYLGIAVVFLILISFMLIKIRKPRITEQKIIIRKNQSKRVISL